MCLPLYPDKLGKQVSLCLASSKLGGIFFLDSTFMPCPPKLEDRPIVIIEQGGIAERAFNAIDGIINNITTTIVFSYYRPNLCREIAKE